MLNGHMDTRDAIRSGRDSGWTTPNGSTQGPMLSPTIQAQYGRGRKLYGQPNYSTLIKPEMISPQQQLQTSPNMIHNLQMQYLTQPQHQHRIQYPQSALMDPDYRMVPQISQGIQLIQDVIQPVFFQQHPTQAQEIQEFVYVQEVPRAVSPQPMRAPPLRERAPPPPPQENERYRERAAAPPEPEIKYVDR